MRRIAKIVLTVAVFCGIVGCAGSGWMARNGEEGNPHYVHVVESGQTLSLIAERFGTTVRSIKAANPGLDPKRLRVGQKLIIPAKDADISEAEYPRTKDGDMEEPDQMQPPQTSNVRRAALEGENVGSGSDEQQMSGIKSKGTSRYKIVKFSRESGNQFSYRFVLALNNEENSSLQTLRWVQQEFREAVKADYVESFPITDIRSLRVDFPEYELDNGKITGRAVVLSISVKSLAYDPNTRTGRLAVKVSANQYEEARKWIRKNIETLARDKNIALVTGEIPPAAKFYLGREELKSGNVLEIEFKTE